MSPLSQMSQLSQLTKMFVTTELTESTEKDAELRVDTDQVEQIESLRVPVVIRIRLRLAHRAS